MRRFWCDGYRPEKVEAGLDLLCDAEIIEEAAGANSISLQILSIYADFAARRDLSESSFATTDRDARPRRRRSGASLWRQSRAARRPHRCSDTISAWPSKTKGARYLTAAGDRARTTYANDDAIRLYRQALAVLLTSAGDRGPTGCCFASASPISVARPADVTRRRSII